MIIRQFRLLILAREVIDNGGRKAQIEKALSVHPFVAEKLEKQARYFSMEQLKDIYHRLLETDENMKTSRMEPGFAIEMFVAEIGRYNQAYSCNKLPNHCFTSNRSMPKR